MANRVWFDARSLSRGYTSGWERYVRELSNHLPNQIDITIWNPNVSNRFSLLLSDYLYRKCQLGHTLIHYPTYPPKKFNNEFKKVITIHDLTWWNYPQASSLLGKFYYKKNMEKAILSADLIITPSNAIRLELSRKFSVTLNNITAIAHGNSLPKGIISKTSRPYFLSIGTIEPRKNLDFYSKAIELSKLNNYFDFIHIGRKGWGTIPKNLKLKIAENDQEMANFISNAQAVVIPSIYEGFGLPVLEAHAQGTPVILSNDPALIELSNTEDRVFELGNLNSLVDSLLNYAETKFKLSTELIHKANDYTWKKSAINHVTAYSRLLNE